MSDTLRAWCRANWNRIDPENRELCLEALEKFILPEDRDYIKAYDSNPFFHMLGGGMAIRNRLRQELRDEALPEITLDHEGKPYGPSQNWDDYYTGALDEFIERFCK